ncbi:hypothetical protein PAXRUDRAFT_13272 [Paxillus rubicundulus Ve08.2h10]|uniref:Uncharacterized protein n=1 Tax=Paxillus rubicundulus Ve08.2h10 TaxID=930991 RepID=A0A0D0D6E4_9AGAM|nr:hypothetical protein PAXRUDRAFT_13272 [Paxillus rubicundulus Ve08.2h10]
MATNSASLQIQHNSTNMLPRTIVAIDKSDAIKMLEDVVFLEIDRIIPNWNMYSFSVQIDIPGVKIEPIKVKHEADTDQQNNTDQRNETEELELTRKVEDHTSNLFPKPFHITPMAHLVLKMRQSEP